MTKYFQKKHLLFYKLIGWRREEGYLSMILWRIIPSKKSVIKNLSDAIYIMECDAFEIILIDFLYILPIA